MKYLQAIKLLLMLISTYCLSNCSSTNYTYTQFDDSNRGLKSKIFSTANFKIFTLEKFTSTNNKLRIYLEGDGKAFIDRSTPSIDPTPTSHFLIDLIKEDRSPNIVYIARPCQYVTSDKCQVKYWTNARFSAEIITAIDEVVKKYSKYEIELIAYSGGGAIAEFIVVQNNNIVNFRTIAGNLDYQKFTEIHQISPLDESLTTNQKILQKLSTIPQIHFVGNQDNIIPLIIAKTYLNKLPDSKCSQIIEVKNASHYQGWKEQWVNLLSIKPKCSSGAS